MQFFLKKWILLILIESELCVLSLLVFRYWIKVSRRYWSNRIFCLCPFLACWSNPELIAWVSDTRSWTKVAACASLMWQLGTLFERAESRLKSSLFCILHLILGLHAISANTVGQSRPVCFCHVNTPPPVTRHR